MASPASVLPRLRVMCGRNAALGPGRVQLLELIGETGSLRAAAGRMGMAYMTAWKHVKTLNRRFRSPVVVAQRGGQTGGGAVLTEMGRRVVALYHRMEEQSQAAIQEDFREFETLLKRVTRRAAHGPSAGGGAWKQHRQKANWPFADSHSQYHLPSRLKPRKRPGRRPSVSGGRGAQRSRR